VIMIVTVNQHDEMRELIQDWHNRSKCSQIGQQVGVPVNADFAKLPSPLAF
jgi:hypothetical protein